MHLEHLVITSLAAFTSSFAYTIKNMLNIQEFALQQLVLIELHSDLCWQPLIKFLLYFTACTVQAGRRGNSLWGPSVKYNSNYNIK